MKILMQKKELIKLIEIIKSTKSELVYVINNTLYTMDREYTILKSVELPNNYFFMEFVTTISQLISALQMFEAADNEYIIDIDIVVGNYILSIRENFIRLIYSIQNILNISTKYYFNDLKQNETFNKILEMKTGDGISKFIVSDYLIMMYNNLLPINKADNVDLIIADINERSFLSNFIIKKKKWNINIYIVNLHLT